MNQKIALIGLVVFVFIGVLVFLFLKPIEIETIQVVQPDNSGQEQSIKEIVLVPEVLIEGLEVPWAIDFLPSGEMVFTERIGRVKLFDGKIVKQIGFIEAVVQTESGLHGIAVDPEFSSNHFVYLYYRNSNGNRVSRFDLVNDSLQNEFVLIEGINSASIHDGGRLKFGPDGFLYISTGDAANPSLALNTDSFAGKILRINKDGSIPLDNPFGNAVFSFGHRNPQGIVWNSFGELFASEHGPSANDEINLIEIGGNFGWPTNCSEQGVGTIAPLRCFSDFTLAPSGIAFFGNDLFVAGLRGSQLRRISFNSDFSLILKEEALFTGLGRIREVVEHNGFLYIATSNRDGRGIPQLNDDKIFRVKLSE